MLSGETIKTEPSPLGLSEPNLDERKCPTLAHSSHTLLSKGEEKNRETFMKYTIQGHRLTKKLIPNHQTIDSLPSPITSPSHY